MLKLFIIATVFVAGTFADEAEAAGAAGAAGIPLSAFDEKEYVLAEADEADYDAVLNAAGFGDAAIAELKKITVGVSLTVDSPKEAGGEYAMEWKSNGASIHKVTFTLDKDEPITIGEDSVPKKFTADENTLVDVSKVGDKEVKVTWEFSDEKVTCHMEVGEVKCDRVYNVATPAA